MPIQSKHWGFMYRSLHYLPHLNMLQTTSITILVCLCKHPTQTQSADQSLHEVLRTAHAGTTSPTSTFYNKPVMAKVLTRSLHLGVERNSEPWAGSWRHMNWTWHHFAEVIKMAHSDLDLVWKQYHHIQVMLCHTNMALVWTGLYLTVINICDSSLNEFWLQKSVLKLPMVSKTLYLTFYFSVPPYLSLSFLSFSETAKQEGR